MSIESRSLQAGTNRNERFNMALAMEAHGITFGHLIEPRGDRLPANKPWGKVLHRVTRPGSTVRVVFPQERRCH